MKTNLYKDDNRKSIEGDQIQINHHQLTTGTRITNNMCSSQEVVV
jgi:hypothetical protein